jgi:hypothetical protein
MRENAAKRSGSTIAAVRPALLSWALLAHIFDYPLVDLRGINC